MAFNIDRNEAAGEDQKDCFGSVTFFFFRLSLDGRGRRKAAGEGEKALAF